MMAIMSNERSAPITVTTIAMKVAGLSCGRMTCHSIFQPCALSRRPGFDLVGRHVVETGQIQDHAIGDLRPQTCEDDAVGDQILVRQNGWRLGTEEVPDEADDAEIGL